MSGHVLFWLLGLLGGVFLLALAYWQLIIAEGAYLGQRVVTWLYDLTAPRYDAIKQFNPEMEAAFLGRPLAQALEQVADPLVLDIATGTARLPIALLEQPLFRGRIVGVDHSRRMLRIAARKTAEYRDRLTLIWQDAAHLPFPDRTFDMVTCLEMLEFTPSPERQLAEAIRVLRPGGVLVTTRRRGFDARLMPGKTYSPEAFAALLERLGLKGVQLLPWQVDYDLALGARAGYVSGAGHALLEILCCPRCKTIGWVERSHSLVCTHCRAVYPIREGVLELERPLRRPSADHFPDVDKSPKPA